MTWAPVRFDGGGFDTGTDIQCDQGVGACSNGVGTVTKVTRVDVGGAYVSAPGCVATQANPCWHQVVTRQSMPATNSANSFGNFYGVCEIKIAPSNTSHLYMYYTLGAGNLTATYVYESLNRGTTWQQTNFPVTTPCNSGDPGSGTTYRFMAPWIAIDPANENVVFVGTPGNGLYFTTNGGNGGGTNWTQVSTAQVPAGTQPADGDMKLGNEIVYDRSSSVVSGRTQGLFATSYGNGVYHSTNGGTNWTILNSTGMPTTFNLIYCDANGTLWVVDNPVGGNNGNLWKFASGAWTKVITQANLSQIATVTVDPAHATPAGSAHVYATDYHGFLNYSLDGGSTWTTQTSWTFNASGNLSMQAGVRNDNTVAIADFAFDPTQNGVLYAADGTGIASTSVPTSAGVLSQTWDGNATWGIQNLVASGGTSPSGGPMMLFTQDRNLWLVSNPDLPQLTYVPNLRRNNVWAANYMVTSQTTMFAHDAIFGSWISTNNGVNWAQLAAQPPQEVPNGANGVVGNMAAYSLTNAVMLLSNNLGPYCVTGGSLSVTPTWSACAFNNGATLTGGGWNASQFYSRNALAADLVATSTYCLYNSGSGTNAGGFYKSTDGQNFTFVVGSAPLDSIGATDATFNMFPVPGKQGHFLAAGMVNVHGALPDSSHHLWRTTTGCDGTWSQVPNVESPFGYSIGATCPDASYPSVFFIGWVDLLDGNGFQYGAFRSDNFNLATPTWIKIGDGFPGGDYDFIITVVGDVNTCGGVYIGYSGTAFMHGKLN